MELKQLNSGPCRTYFIGCAKTKEAALVDPVIASVEDYLKFLDENGWALRYVVDTHTHADHILVSVLLRERTGAAYACTQRRAPSTRTSASPTAPRSHSAS